MRTYTRSPLLNRQRTGKTGRPGWWVLVLGLLALNGYLFIFRGLPVEVRQARAAQPPPMAVQAGFMSTLGEMRGVGGVRTASLEALKPKEHLSSLRFELNEAAGVSGQRTLESWCHKRTGAIARGDNFSSALLRSGLKTKDVLAITEALRGVFDFRHCRIGDRFDVLQSPAGQVERFTYHPSPLSAYRVERQADKLIGRRVQHQPTVKVESVGLQVQGSLYASLERIGESAGLVMQLVEIFAWDVDFYVDTQRGDQVRLLVEKKWLNGEFVGYGRILAAEYSGVTVGQHLAFYYEPQNDTDGYYDANGDSLRKAFLKSPLKFARISSRYGMRVHPILGFNKMHHGVDFAAPIGTPVWAPADGRVVFAGTRGASGRMVALRHANGYETVYLHLSRIAANIRPGARIRQKELIGAVGNTGRSTGPHLHYGMKLNGQHINPLGQRFPPASPVPPAELDQYRKRIQPIQSRLATIPVRAPARTAAMPAGQKPAG